MSIFDDGQVDELSLDDEFLLDEIARQESDQPQDQDIENNAQQGAESSPEARTSEDEPLDAEAAPDTAGQAEPGNKEAPETIITPELAKLQKSYDEVRSFSTRMSMENGSLRQEIAALKGQIIQSQRMADFADPEKRESALQSMMANPYEWAEKAMTPVLEQRISQALSAEREERQRTTDAAALNTALDKVASKFTSASTSEGKTVLVEKMVEIGQRLGDGYIWRKNPDAIAKQAAIELWDIPKVIDQTAVTAAAEQAKAQAIAELQAKNAAKPGLTAQNNNNKEQSAELSPEEKILKGIFSGQNGGLFD